MIKMSQHESTWTNWSKWSIWIFYSCRHLLGIKFNSIYGIIKKYNPNSRKFPTHKKKIIFLKLNKIHLHKTFKSIRFRKKVDAVSNQWSKFELKRKINEHLYLSSKDTFSLEYLVSLSFKKNTQVLLVFLVSITPTWNTQYPCVI